MSETVPALAGRLSPAGGLIPGNSGDHWILALAVAAAVFFALVLIKTLVARRLRGLAEKTESILDDLLLDLIEHHTRSWFVVVVALFAGTMFLEFAPKVELVIRQAAVAVAGLQGILWGNAAVDYYIHHSPRLSGGGSRAAASTYTIINFIAKLFIVVVVLLLTMHNLGINVTALVAGLGVGGVAVALALQNILGDLFASMAIVLDKPFEIGDAIVVDGLAGTVEQVGLKTTRLRSLSGEQLVFSNTDLLRSRIHNFKRMAERRMTFTVGITYATPQPVLAAIPGILREIVECRGKVRFDRAHLVRFADFSILYEAVYFVLDPDFNLSLDIQQDINLALAERFAREGIEFACPTTTVLLSRKGEAQGRDGHPALETLGLKR